MSHVCTCIATLHKKRSPNACAHHITCSQRKIQYMNPFTLTYRQLIRLLYGNSKGYKFVGAMSYSCLVCGVSSPQTPALFHKHSCGRWRSAHAIMMISLLVCTTAATAIRCFAASSQSFILPTCCDLFFYLLYLCQV